MTTVLFVHGTGVREPGYGGSLERIREGLAAVRPDVTVAPCHWGGSAGSALRADGLSVPGYGTGRAAPGEEDPEAGDVEFWGLLYVDPLLELRLLAPESGARAELAPGAAPAGEALTAAALALARDEVLRGLLDAAGIGGEFAAAVAAVVTSPDGRDFLRSPAAPGEPDALARAFVAEAVRRTAARGPAAPALDGTARDAAVARIAALLPGDAAGSHRGPVTRRVGRLAGRLVLGLASAQAVRRRSALTDAAHPAAGDVLLYLARGEAIREAVAAAVRAARPPVVVLAHSLGGIASLDLLVLRELPEVRLLVTVGSQAPFLYELGALPSLEYGAPLPAHVPPWINVYDRRDLLSYVGAGLFPGRVRDVAVDGRQPFPMAHSAYWGNPELYRLLAAELP
ncbi:hypothetical protein [Streptomyces hydrogenans]|uniref:AB hydrolase-1 domain-containing protein n=1 Tax=Streptomyces hydrogenans TaxID=1873719 RepID=A0ABQ3P808_9ACTN|nr:hypothetical protein [Streptomyces hydrogenans]GHI21156.1 hypothetical protein Shyd_25270 [Streptomyces hydrogenans]